MISFTQSDDDVMYDCQGKMIYNMNDGKGKQNKEMSDALNDL